LAGNVIIRINIKDVNLGRALLKLKNALGLTWSGLLRELMSSSCLATLVDGWSDLWHGKRIRGVYIAVRKNPTAVFRSINVWLRNYRYDPGLTITAYRERSAIMMRFAVRDSTCVIFDFMYRTMKPPDVEDYLTLFKVCMRKTLKECYKRGCKEIKVDPNILHVFIHVKKMMTEAGEGEQIPTTPADRPAAEGSLE